jgi:two-component system, NtrC family, sensor kinase
MGRGPKPTKGKARPAAARKSPKDEDARVRDLEKGLAEARQREAEAQEQLEATAEILRIIGSSPGDAQPVFDAIAVNALRLCDAKGAVVVRYDGTLLHVAAHHNVNPDAVDHLQRQFPRAPDRRLPMGRAVLDGAVVHAPDLQGSVEFSESVARQFGAGSQILIPLLRQGRAIGAIGISRQRRGPFSERQIALLQTFADQAVIAIENVRLFNETKEALEQQTATSDILRVISSSPTDIQPVVDSIAAKALDLCQAKTGAVFRFDGELIHVVAANSFSPEAVEAHRQTYPIPPGRGGATARAILSGAVVYIPDIREDPEYEHQALATATDYLSALSVPMLHEGEPIGAITVTKAESGAFSQRQIELLQTFADQAVIAIENVRLFKELEARNRDLTATSQILQVISTSPTDVQPVFDTIVQSAVRLCDGLHGFVGRFDGELIHIAAHYNYTPEALQMMQRMYPRPPDRKQAAGRTILTGDIVNIDDLQADPEYATDLAVAGGWRGILSVPMLREGKPIGTIGVIRGRPGLFSDAQVELLKTFADQAVIAIENVRLFTELQEKNQALTQAYAQVSEALEQQTATSEILRVISSSPTDVQPVFDAIARSAVRLLGGFSGVVTRVVGDHLHLAALTSTDPSGDAAQKASWPRPLTGTTLHSQVITALAPRFSTDIEADRSWTPTDLARARTRGFRSIVIVPLLREGRAIGTMSVTRRSPGPFADGQVALLQTFADQAAIAIENVRLFKELEAANRELAAASQHKSEFLANMSHELRTPLNAIIGFSEVLAEKMFGELNEKQEEYSKDIHASGQHLLSLINDILDLSKIEAGRMELEVSEFHLPFALDSALTLVRERAGRRGLALQINVDERLGQIPADERKVRQVVLNLLSNAIKFTPEGGRIEVRATPQDGLVEVSVSDTGVGIAPEDQEAVFEEFRQVGTADKKVEGTGLGLTLCRKFVELHGGRIWVKSQLGAGSTFTFTLPVRRGE